MSEDILPANKLAMRPKAMAAALDVSERTLWEWRRSRGFPTVTIAGTVLHPVDAARRWLEAQIDADAMKLAAG